MAYQISKIIDGKGLKKEKNKNLKVYKAFTAWRRPKTSETRVGEE